MHRLVQDSIPEDWHAECEHPMAVKLTDRNDMYKMLGLVIVGFLVGWFARNYFAKSQKEKIN
jgi:uncharacterized membrane protein YbjE (DUF340 family)